MDSSSNLPSSVDKIKLIKLIEKNGPLWNNRIRSYSNMKIKKECWVEVCKGLYDEYDNLSDRDKEGIQRHVHNTWLNVRDAYRRSIKNGSQIRPYYASKHLKFLDDIQANAKCKHVNTKTKVELEPTDVYEEEEHLIEEPIDFPMEIKTVESTSNPISTTDDSFFTSFRCYIEDFSEDEKLDLHFEIINAIKRIKHKRKKKHKKNCNTCVIVKCETNSDEDS